MGDLSRRLFFSFSNFLDYLYLFHFIVSFQNLYLFKIYIIKYISKYILYLLNANLFAFNS